MPRNSGPYDHQALAMAVARGASSLPPGRGQRVGTNNAATNEGPGLCGPDGSEDGAGNTESNPNGYYLDPGEGRRLSDDDQNAVGHYWSEASRERVRQDGR